MKLINRISGRTPVPVVSFDDHELSLLCDGTTLFKILWTDVCEIVAFKEDLFGVDSICIGFRVSNLDEYCRVVEESTSYKDLIAEIESRFPGIRTDWFKEVAFPAFAVNWTTIWGTPYRRQHT